MSHPSKSLTLTLFGQPQIRLDGEPLSGKLLLKAQALVFYLAVTGQAHSRSHLAGLLWSDRPEETARGNLRTVLTRLRKPLGDLLITSRQQVALAEDVWLDSAEFERGLAVSTIPSLTAALPLYTNDFLADLTLSGAPLFEEWQQLQRERLRLLAVDGWAKLAELQQAQANLPEAIAATRQLLTLDPLREDGHRRLIRLLAMSGDRAAAVAQFEACRQLLAAELGVAPAPATIALAQQLQVEATPLPAAPDHTQPIRSNLPAIASSFHGRSAEINQIIQTLSQPDCRLLTLVGMGGIGKTRLALEAARTLAQRTDFDPTLHAQVQDGIFWAPIETATAENELLVALAQTFDLPLAGQKPLKATLQNFLRDKRLLLILDNFEQLTVHAPLLSDLLRDADGLRLLVTSRERLNLYEEWLLPVEGLPLPDTTDTVAASAAIDLFVQRARRRNLQFSLAQQADGVRRICALVEGMPLGIELATAWTQTLSCSAIADAIADSVRTLQSDLQNVPGRHQSIEAVFRHSWALLPEDERLTLAQLSVFRGGFSAESAQSITQCSRRTLATLVEKSLVQRQENGRFDLHNLIRQLAAERVADSAELATRHQRHYLQWVADQQEAILSGSDPQQTAAVARDLDNLRAAWHHAAQAPDAPTLAAAAYSLLSLWMGSGLVHEGLALSQQVAQRLTETNGLAAGRMRLCEATFANLLGKSDEALAAVHTAIALFEQLDSPVDLGKALSQATFFLTSRNEYDEARQLADRALAVLEPTGDRRALGNGLLQRYVVESFTGDTAVARQLIERALTLLTAPRDRLAALARFGASLIGSGEYAQAVAMLRESAETAALLNAQDQQASSLINIAVAQQRSGQFAQAEAAAREALALFERHGEVFGMATCHNNLGNIAYKQGSFAEAIGHYRRAEPYYASSNNQLGLALAKYGIGSASSELLDSNGLALLLEANGILQQAGLSSLLPTVLPRTARCLLLRNQVDLAAQLTGSLLADGVEMEAFARGELAVLEMQLRERVGTAAWARLADAGCAMGWEGVLAEILPTF